MKNYKRKWKVYFLSSKRKIGESKEEDALGSTQRSWMFKEEAISPTVATELVLITGVIDAKQERDVMSLGIPNAFVQTLFPPINERTTMKIRGRLADLLLEINYKKHASFVHYTENGKILCVKIMEMLYGLLKSSLICYEMFVVLNPYEIFIANKII